MILVELIDSYSSSNANYNYPIFLGTSADRAGGQSIQPALDVKLSIVNFYLAKAGTPTGSAYVRVYNASGTYGVNNRPTGTAVGTSVALDVSTLKTTSAWVSFNFSPSISLTGGSSYVLFLEYDSGTVANHILLGTDNTSETHSGNMCLFDNNYGTTSVVTNGGSTYFCKAYHVSSADDEPGVGVNWNNYWEIYRGSGTPWALLTEYNCVLVIWSGEAICFEAFSEGMSVDKMPNLNGIPFIPTIASQRF